MMVPMTKFDIIDQSNVPDIKPDVPQTPVCLVSFASDKGPEEFISTYGANFYKLYGSNISFEKYGQPLLQASRIIDAGGKVLVKRVVAPDSSLANLGIFLSIKKITVQATNNAGNLLYIDAATGADTTVVTGNTPKMVDNCELKYVIKTYAGKVDIESIDGSMQSFLSEDDDKKVYFYPIATITDNGRGLSNKRIKISPDYKSSKNTDYVKYLFQEIEDNTVVESLAFTVKPNVIEYEKNLSLNTVITSNSMQLKCKLNDANLDSAYSKISAISGVAVEDLKNLDILFAKDKKGNDLNNIILNLSDADAINLSYPYGLALPSGSNGSFGSGSVITNPDYTAALVNFFNGTFTKDIYNLDNYKIDVVIDANYPSEVKRAIEDLVIFREDAEFFEDMGTGLYSMDNIISVGNTITKNKAIAAYHASYDILDPFTKKQITVTIGYSLATLLVNHFLNGRSRPLAGQLYNMTIPEAISGTVNFIPRVSPGVDEKEMLLDNKINYVSYFDDVLTIETLYTTQEVETQLSYVNNVLAMQEIVKAVRSKCPKIRYSFLTGDDLKTYQEDVQAVLDKYAGNFKSLKMQYMQDSSMIANKVFYATITVEFKDFVQTEYFKLYVIN